MPTVAILGAGELGGAAAQALATFDVVSRVVLVDDARGVAAGKALDIQQSGAVQHFHTTIAGTADPAAATTAALCIVADRHSAPAGGWASTDGLSALARYAGFINGVPMVFAEADPLAAMERVHKELGWARPRLIGSAPEAVIAALRALVALDADCSPGDVALTVLGTPAGFVVPWSDATVGGHAIDRVLSHAQITRLDARLPRLWPPGPYALGAAAARVARTVVGVGRIRPTVFAVLDHEFGARGRVGAVPVALSPAGIDAIRLPPLNTRERIRVETAVQA
ncbi:MAG: hypothetical protein FJW23_13715 [Acidimicrobiia bacterium]|nr:hypothetical protein [Acidimicrobiia bacterium]